MPDHSPHWSTRLPFYYGWVIVGVAFVTMALGVTARTSFSLLMPPLIDEFGWDRGLAAGAFSFGFLVSAVISPMVGRVLDVRGPRVVILTGVLVLTADLGSPRASGGDLKYWRGRRLNDDERRGRWN